MKVRESFSFKALCLFLSFLSVAASFVLYANCALAELPSLDNAESVYLYCVESKKILAQKNLNATIYPASTVKLMTGLIAAEKLADRMEETVTVTRSMISGVDGTSMKLSEGDRVRIIDLFYGAICRQRAGGNLLRKCQGFCNAYEQSRGGAWNVRNSLYQSHRLAR